MTLDLKMPIVSYSFDVSKPDELEEWETLRRQLKQTHECDVCHWEYISNNGREYLSKLKEACEVGYVTLDPDTLFSDQFNTAEGLRVYDWSHIEYANPDIKSGFYIPDLSVLKHYRSRRYQCGYCAYYEDLELVPTENKFCPSCLTHANLELKNLALTVLHPIGSKRKRPVPTELEIQERIDFRTQQLNDPRNHQVELEEDQRKALRDHETRLSQLMLEFKITNWFINANIPTDHLRFYIGGKKDIPIIEITAQWGMSDLHVRWAISRLIYFPWLYEIKGVSAEERMNIEREIVAEIKSKEAEYVPGE